MHLPQQRGAFLIALMAMIGLVFLASLVAGLPDKRPQAYGQETTAMVLAEAREALIGYAVSYEKIRPGQAPGYLPCPDVNGDGEADPFTAKCGPTGENAIGRLPWKTLGIEPLRDGQGELLWYAVAGTFKANEDKTKLTDSTSGRLLIRNDSHAETFVGATSTTPALAIVFAPGRALAAQTRDSAANASVYNDPTQYLDSHTYAGDTIDNAAGHSTSALSGEPGYEPLQDGTREQSVFVMAVQSEQFNDVLRPVTYADVFNVIPSPEEWVTQKIITCLETYKKTSPTYPWAAALNAAAAPDYNDDVGSCFGRIAEAPLDRTVSSNAGASSTWPSGCFDSSVTDGWWNNWKDSTFVAVKKDSTPDSSQVTGTPDCSNLKVKIPSNKNVKLLVIFGGEALAGKSQTSDAEKADVANYLEAENSTPTPADDQFEYQVESTTFNDKVCYLQASSTSIECPWK